jgi:transposase-like protein
MTCVLWSGSSLGLFLHRANRFLAVARRLHGDMPQLKSVARYVTMCKTFVLDAEGSVKVGTLTDKIDFNGTCPKCGRPVRINMGRAMSTKRARCSSCGSNFSVKFTGDDPQQIDRAVDDLKRSLRGLNTKLNIKL